jgi:NADH dehydrogenase/NADH:ubiquinone oxidoreductase subunit G
MNPDKQLQKLEGILQLLETDRASTDEVVEMFNAVFEIIKQLKDQIDQEMRQNKGEMDDLFAGTIAEINKIEHRLDTFKDRIEQKLAVDNDSIRKQITTEVNRLAELIPTLPDLTYLEKKIEEVKGLIPKIPDELKAEQIRNKLETLKGAERLDASAIKGLEALVKETKTIISGGLTRAKTDSLYTKYHGGASNIYVSDTAPSNPQLYDLWVDIS